MTAPTSPQALPALHARVRAATGPDREIDDAIHIMAHPQLASLKRSWSGGWEHPEHGPIRQSDRYTDSIDVCIALAERVLPGINCHGYDATPKGVTAYVSRNNVPEGHWLFEGEAATPALAMITAILSALIAKEQSP